MSHRADALMPVLIGCVAVMALVAGGCGGTTSVEQAGTAATTTITGNVVNGPVNGATVTLYSMKTDGSKGTTLGTTTTNTDGNYTFTLAAALTSEAIVEATGGSYVDEATGHTITMTALDSLLATLPFGTKVAAVTPLTHMAAARMAQLFAAGGISLASAIATGYLAIEQQYSLTSILTTLPVAANITQPKGTTALQSSYGVVLAGIAKQAQLMSVRAHVLASFLARDMADGNMDGKLNAVTAFQIPTFIAGGLASVMPTTMAANFQTMVNTFLNDPRNLTGLVSGAVFVPPTAITGVNLSSLLSTFTTTTSGGTTTTTSAMFTLTVTVSGTGNVGSNPPGIACSAGTCSFSFPSGQTVFLGAMPPQGKTFTYSGACSGTTNPCQVFMNAAKTVTVTFSP